MRLLTPLILIVVIIASLLYYTLQQGEANSASIATTLGERARGGLVNAPIDETKSPNVNPRVGKAVLRGRAIDPAGKPVAGARILCERRTLAGGDPFAPPPGGSRWVAETSATGDFEISGMPAGGFAVLASTETHTGVGTVTTAEGGAIAEVLLALQPVARFEGTITLPDDRPAEGAVIAPLGQGGSADFRFFPARANSQGQYTFSYLPKLPATFLIKRHGYAPKLVEGILPESHNTEIVLEEGVYLKGEVRESGTGVLLPQVKVALREQGLGIEATSTTTDANGEFHFEHLRRAVYTLDLVPDRYVLAGQLPVIDLGGESTPPPVLQAERAGGLRGRVVDLSGQKGRAAVPVVALLGTRRFQTLTDTSGYYLFRALPPGDYRIALDKTGGLAPGAAADTVGVVAGQQVNGPTLTAPTLASVRGRVVDDADRAAAGANVYLSLDGTETPHLATATDADGFFTLDGVDQEANVRVWASRMGRISVAYGPVRVGSAGISELNFVLDMSATAAIRGMVRNAAGTPVAALEVQCLSSDTSLEHPASTHTGTDGAFAFLGLRPGSYRLAAGPAIADIAGSTAHRVDLADGEQRDQVVLTIP